MSNLQTIWTLEKFEQALANRTDLTVRSDVVSKTFTSQEINFTVWDGVEQLGGFRAQFTISPKGIVTKAQVIFQTAIFQYDQKQIQALDKLITEVNTPTEATC